MTALNVPARDDAAPPRDDAAAVRATEIELFSLAGHDGHLREVNEAFARLLGLEPSQVDGRSLLELAHPDDIGNIVAGLSALQAGAGEVLLENRFAQSDGGWVHLQWVARPVPGTDLWWAAGRDTTEFHRLLTERTNLRARLDLVIGQATAAMWDLDVSRGLLTWEAQGAEVLGVAVAAVPTTVAELAAVVSPGDGPAVTTAFAQLLEIGATEAPLRVGNDAELRHLSLRGKVLDRDRRGRPVRAVGLVLDVTTEKAMEEQMLRMIMSDALTGVPNRRAFDQALRTQWRRCLKVGEPISVLMIDIDNFKRFNDTFGHLVGDEVLCAVARALTGVLARADDFLARFGGEEFAVVLPGSDRIGAGLIADRLVEAVRTVSVRQAADWPLSVSIGTRSWHPGDDPIKTGEALAQADQALYAAKTAGKNRAVAHEAVQVPLSVG